MLACRVFEDDGRVAGRVVTMSPDDLTAGDVVIRAVWSGINYKDALAVTGRGKIMRRLPLNAGIDVAGTVEASSDPRFTPGQAVLVNGMGLGEKADGGFAERVRVPGDWIVPLPPGLTPRDAMALGTAGFTAAQALLRMEALGQRPEMGPMVVTGASGGVGSIAVSILSARGYEVVAVSGRREHGPWLTGLGAGSVRTPDELEIGTRPLETAKFGGAIDNVGGELLAGLLRHVSTWGTVAAVGNAASPDLHTTVFPFILRGVSLLGVSSTNCPMPLRQEIWRRLGQDLRPKHLDSIATRTVPLGDVVAESEALIERGRHGRILVDCSTR